MRFCATQLQPIEAASKSDPYKKYVVELRPVDSAHPKCSCMAWIMARSRARKALTSGEVNADLAGKCKHLAAALKATCDWEGDVTGPCPKCGADTATLGDDTPRPEIAEAPAGPAPTVGMPELRPMLAEEINADRIAGFVHDDRHWMQQKVDGHRVLIHVESNVGFFVLGRGGQPSQHGARFSRPAYADLSRLSGVVLDGELVGDVFWVFDLPHFHAGGIDTSSPYSERQVALERLFESWEPDGRYIRLLPTAKTSVDKAQLALHLLQTQAEGVMIKDTAADYQPGARSRDTLKAKFRKTLDVQVIGVGTKGHDNIAFGLHGPEGLVPVGEVTALAGDGAKIKALWAEGRRDLVIEVTCLYATEANRIYQPTLPRLRTSKLGHECTLDQLDAIRVNKTVLV